MARHSWAVEGGADEWQAAIRAVHAMMRSREELLATQGLSGRRRLSEMEPVTLIVDEATTIAGQQLDADAANKLLAILSEGRRLGIRVSARMKTVA